MKKLLTTLVLVPFLAGMVMAMDLGGKLGIGLRADGFSIRKFVNNNIGLDLSANYDNSTQTGKSDTKNYDYSVGGFWVKEIYEKTFFEAGATLQGWQGNDNTGSFYNGLSINPFVGAECFINEHVSIDGKFFIGLYNSEMNGATRTTSLDFLSGNLGAHIYF